MTFAAHALAASLTLCVLASAADAAPVDDAVAALQREWETIAYRVPAAERTARYEKLAARAREASAAFPGSAEPLVWEGIVVSSWAGAKGGLGALPLARQAKDLYESAIRIRPDALQGSALNSLGVLYYKVPGWPIGFGDKERARQLLKQALAINPDGIDTNFFYADYLVETGHAADAVPILERALKAPPRPGREIADAGRREEAIALLARAKGAAR